MSRRAALAVAISSIMAASTALTVGANVGLLGFRTAEPAPLALPVESGIHADPESVDPPAVSPPVGEPTVEVRTVVETVYVPVPVPAAPASAVTTSTTSSTTSTTVTTTTTTTTTTATGPPATGAPPTEEDDHAGTTEGRSGWSGEHESDEAERAEWSSSEPDDR